MLSEDPSTLRADADGRERIRSSLDESLIVEAAAGTGKTTELVRRLVAVLQEGKTTVDSIVAVTFTRKAAGELKLRLRQGLDQARGQAQDEVRKKALEDALERLEEAHIGTIHSFCGEILRERPVEARVDPAFRELDAEESARLYDRAFRSWIERRLSDMPEGLRRALSRLAHQRSPDGSSPLDRLREAGRSLVDWRDFPSSWRREPFDRAALIDQAVHQVHAVAEMVRRCQNKSDYLRRALEPAEALSTWIRRSDEVSPHRDDDELEAQLTEVLRSLRRNLGWKGRGNWFAPGISRDDALTARDALIEVLDDFRRRADADLATLLHDELGEVLDGYEERKRRTGRLDFLDLLISARDLVRDDAEVRRYLQRRFTHLFVDEFQDTDPLQAEILLLLASDNPDEDHWRRARPVPGKLFLVGDPKQSIYRFRRADVVLYEDIKERLTQSGVGLVHMTQSFRALRPIQAAVNAAFRSEMTGDRAHGQPAYVPLDPYRGSVESQPQIVALPAPRPYGWSKVTARAIEQCLPDTVAAFVEWLVTKSGWTVEDPDSRERVSIGPRHIALLFRRFMSWGEDITRGYIRDLEARNIPHILVGGRSFHQREEVETIRAALTAVEWPDDELAVYATLRGGLFAVSDDLLLRYRFEIGTLHPFRVPDETPNVFIPIFEALRLLARLHRDRNRVPVVETLHELLEFTRAHAGFALRPAGHQVLANVQRICDMARSFEVRGGLSFRGFVERLNDEAERPGASQSPVLEEGADGVRVMTAHAAKGLEFPVVILCDLTARIVRPEPGLYVNAENGLAALRLMGCTPWEILEHAELEQQRDQAEGVRLAYVAATRARDLLVVPAVGDEPFEKGWLDPLTKAIYPPSARCRESEPGPGCPRFGEATVLARSDRFIGDDEWSVKPGLHRPMAGEHKVVWWDPKALQLDIEGDFGVRREKILSADDPEGVEEGNNRYQEWRSDQRDALEDGAVPEVELTIVTQAEEPPEDFAAEVTVERLEKAAGRPSGIRFGTLVHTVLRDVGFAAEAEEVRRLAELHGRVLDASEEEMGAAIVCVKNALVHPVMRRAAAADRCHREAPFVLRYEDDKIVEGTIDLLFRENGSWFVVDFKTDVDDAELADKYHRQLAWYLFAVRRMMDASVQGILLSL